MTSSESITGTDAPPVVKVLLVDDRPANIVALRAVVEPLGHECIPATSGTEALKLVLQNDFAVILLDVMMPGLDGLETIRLIKQRPRSRNTPVILVSAKGMNREDLLTAYAVGAVDYITKPFEPDILRAKVSVFAELFVQRETMRRQAARIAAHEQEAKLLAVEHKARVEAEEASRRRDDLLANVSHDLRSPLSVITTTVGAVRRALQGTEHESVVPHLARIDRSAQRMEHLIRDLLDIAVIDSGHLSIETISHRVDELTGEFLETLRMVAREKRIALTVDHEDSSAIVNCDKPRIEQVFGNLVGNAIKFTPAGGTIAIASRAADGMIEFTVRDTGAGIPPDQVPHVFDRFWHASENAKTGTGLGLAICRGIVERHGGTIRCESVIGTGTTFTFTLPRVATAQSS